MKLINIVLTAAAVMAVSACDSNNDDAVKTSFKDGFMGTCVKSAGAAPNAKEICDCMGDDLLDNFSVKELSDQSNIEKIKLHTVTNSAKKCVAK